MANVVMLYPQVILHASLFSQCFTKKKQKTVKPEDHFRYFTEQVLLKHCWWMECLCHQAAQNVTWIKGAALQLIVWLTDLQQWKKGHVFWPLTSALTPCIDLRGLAGPQKVRSQEASAHHLISCTKKATLPGAGGRWTQGFAQLKPVDAHFPSMKP